MLDWTLHYSKLNNTIDIILYPIYLNWSLKYFKLTRKSETRVNESTYINYYNILLIYYNKFI